MRLRFGDYLRSCNGTLQRDFRRRAGRIGDRQPNQPDRASRSADPRRNPAGQCPPRGETQKRGKRCGTLFQKPPARLRELVLRLPMAPSNETAPQQGARERHSLGGRCHKTPETAGAIDLFERRESGVRCKRRYHRGQPLRAKTGYASVSIVAHWRHDGKSKFGYRSKPAYRLGPWVIRPSDRGFFRARKVSRACADEKVRDRLLLLAKEYLDEENVGRVSDIAPVRARHCLTD